MKGPKRCPACGANRNVEKVVGTNLIGRQCVICRAQWIGELVDYKDRDD